MRGRIALMSACIATGLLNGQVAYSEPPREPGTSKERPADLAELRKIVARYNKELKETIA